MANSDCTAAHVQACAIRVTKLDATGAPLVGITSIYVSDALTQLQVETVIEEGEEFTVKNACGATCVNVKDCDRLKRLNLTLGLCRPDPELQASLTGGVVLTGDTVGGLDATGYGLPKVGVADCPNGVSLELWAKRYLPGGSLDPDFPYEWYVIPKTFFNPGRRTFENGPITVELNGFAVENENWGAGPDGDFPDDTDRLMQNIPTTDIPTVQCGFIELAS